MTKDSAQLPPKIYNYRGRKFTLHPVNEVYELWVETDYSIAGVIWPDSADGVFRFGIPPAFASRPIEKPTDAKSTTSIHNAVDRLCDLLIQHDQEARLEEQLQEMRNFYRAPDLKEVPRD